MVVSEPGKATAVGAQPQAPVLVQQEAEDGRIGQAPFATVAFDDPPDMRLSPPQRGSDPEVAIWRLRQSPDRIAEKAIFLGECPHVATQYPLQTAIGAGQDLTVRSLQQAPHCRFALGLFPRAHE